MITAIPTRIPMTMTMTMTMTISRVILHSRQREAGLSVPGMGQRQLIAIEMDVLAKNNALAAHNREHFDEAAQLVLNLVSSPGSGKTTLLCETLRQLADKRPCAVIEGDQQTSADADRIRATGVPAVQINTGKGCHLDAKMVHDAATSCPPMKGASSLSRTWQSGLPRQLRSRREVQGGDPLRYRGGREPLKYRTCLPPPS
jgi:hypothetical protein